MSSPERTRWVSGIAILAVLTRAFVQEVVAADRFGVRVGEKGECVMRVAAKIRDLTAVSTGGSSTPCR